MYVSVSSCNMSSSSDPSLRVENRAGLCNKYANLINHDINLKVCNVISVKNVPGY